MISARQRLIVATTALVALPACVEVEQKLDFHQDGTIGYHWRLGMLTEIANGPFGKTPEEREASWAAMVPEAAKAYVTAHVESSPDRVWLVLDAALPDVEAYDLFRDAFIARFEDDHEPNPMLYPPTVEAYGSAWIVEVSVPPRPDAAELKVRADSQATWTLQVHPWKGARGHDADRVDADGTLVWQRPIAQVLRDGVDANASIDRPGVQTFTVLVAGAVVLLIGAGGLLAWQRTRAAP